MIKMAINTSMAIGLWVLIIFVMIKLEIIPF
jgi:hypothetical protein